MLNIKKRKLSRVMPFYFRSTYGTKFSKIMTESFNLAKQEAAQLSSIKKSKSKKSKKLKIIKKPKPGVVFLFNKNIYLPPIFARKRISVYTGKSFFSFVVKLKYIYTRLSEFVSTKKFGPDIHKKVNKKKKSKKLFFRVFFL